MQDVHSKAQKAQKRYSALETLRSPWMTDWRELADLIDPMAVRTQSTERNKGQRSRGSIIDNTATLALTTLQAGLMSGMTSPARPWARLTIPDDDLAEYEPVKEWLSAETRRLLSIFHKSNTYLTLHQLYGQLGLIGSSFAVSMNSYERVIDHYTSPIGEFCLAGDFNGTVNTGARKFEKTVDEVVREFGNNNCSARVQSLYDTGNLDATVSIVHLIQPRPERDTRKKDSRNKAYSSCYFEEGGYGDVQGYLRESGYDDFPGLAPRWSRRSGDIYGTSPAMNALGDVKQLQHMQLHKGKAIEYQVNPPVQAPVSLQNSPMDMLPGGIVFADLNGPNSAISPLWEVNLNLQDLREDIYDVRQRIESAMFTGVFRMFEGDQTGQMTATEVAERHEEKMLMLGPVLERLHGELLRPMVENTFARMIEVGATSTPPPELQGMELEVEFVSVLAQAQRAIGNNGVDRFIGSLGTVAMLKPDVLDKFDADEWAERYSDGLGVDPKMIIGNERVGFIREARAEQQRKEQQLASVNARADAAAKLGTVRTDQPNAASDIMTQLQGYGDVNGALV